MDNVQRCIECGKLIGVLLEDGSVLIGDNRVIEVAMYCGNCGNYYEWKKRGSNRFDIWKKDPGRDEELYG